MKVLVAEDEYNIAMSYKIALERNNHEITLTPDGEKCLLTYRESLDQMKQKDRTTPFDVLLLDYKMPKKDGMEIAKEVLKLNPRQRIIFASAFVKDTLVDSVKQLNQIVELMQKPFGAEELVDTIEDKEIYQGLERLNIDIKKIKGFNPTHEEIRDFLEGLHEVMKGRTF